MRVPFPAPAARRRLATSREAVSAWANVMRRSGMITNSRSPKRPAARWLARPSVASLVDGLVAKGLVDRHAHVDDRRRVTLVLTVKGQQTVAQADALISARLGAIADFLSDEESARAFDGLLLWGRAQAAQAEARSVTPA